MNTPSVLRTHKYGLGARLRVATGLNGGRVGEVIARRWPADMGPQICLAFDDHFRSADIWFAEDDLELVAE